MRVLTILAVSTALLVVGCGREAKPVAPILGYPSSPYAEPIVNPVDSTIGYAYARLVRITRSGREYTYQSTDSGTTYWLMNWDGTRQRKVLPHYFVASSWSPDGRTIVYDGQEVASLAWDGDTLDETTRIPITSSIHGRPKWNRAMTQMIASSGQQILIWTAATSQVREYGEHGWFDPDWSPDGSKIVFHAYVDQLNALMVADTSGSNSKVLVSGLTYLACPSWSPDGSRIAFVGKFGNDDVQLWTVLPGGTGLTQITNDGVGERFSWSPSGKTIVFVHFSFREQTCVNSQFINGTIWRIDPSSRDRRQLTFNAGLECP